MVKPLLPKFPFLYKPDYHHLDVCNVEYIGDIMEAQRYTGVAKNIYKSHLQTNSRTTFWHNYSDTVKFYISTVGRWIKIYVDAGYFVCIGDRSSPTLVNQNGLAHNRSDSLLWDRADRYDNPYIAENFGCGGNRLYVRPAASGFSTTDDRPMPSIDRLSFFIKDGGDWTDGKNKALSWGRKWFFESNALPYGASGNAVYADFRFFLGNKAFDRRFNFVFDGENFGGGQINDYYAPKILASCYVAVTEALLTAFPVLTGSYPRAVVCLIEADREYYIGVFGLPALAPSSAVINVGPVGLVQIALPVPFSRDYTIVSGFGHDGKTLYCAHVSVPSFTQDVYSVVFDEDYLTHTDTLVYSQTVQTRTDNFQGTINLTGASTSPTFASTTGTASSVTNSGSAIIVHIKPDRDGQFIALRMLMASSSSFSSTGDFDLDFIGPSSDGQVVTQTTRHEQYNAQTSFNVIRFPESGGIENGAQSVNFTGNYTVNVNESITFFWAAGNLEWRHQYTFNYSGHGECASVLTYSFDALLYKIHRLGHIAQKVDEFTTGSVPSFGGNVPLPSEIVRNIGLISNVSAEWVGIVSPTPTTQIYANNASVHNMTAQATRTIIDGVQTPAAVTYANNTITSTIYLNSLVVVQNSGPPTMDGVVFSDAYDLPIGGLLNAPVLPGNGNAVFAGDSRRATSLPIVGHSSAYNDKMLLACFNVYDDAYTFIYDWEEPNQWRLEPGRIDMPVTNDPEGITPDNSFSSLLLYHYPISIAQKFY